MKPRLLLLAFAIATLVHSLGCIYPDPGGRRGRRHEDRRERKPEPRRDRDHEDRRGPMSGLTQ